MQVKQVADNLASVNILFDTMTKPGFFHLLPEIRMAIEIFQ